MVVVEGEIEREKGREQDGSKCGTGLTVENSAGAQSVFMYYLAHTHTHTQRERERRL